MRSIGPTRGVVVAVVIVVFIAVVVVAVVLVVDAVVVVVDVVVVNARRKWRRGVIIG